MIKELFNELFYQPIYNGFVFLISVVPGGDVGIAIIVLTVFVKLIILPLTHKSVSSQAKIKKLDPQIKALKEKYKDDKQEQARKIMELYKEHGVNPFTGCSLLLVQMPIVIALYFVFFKGLANPNPELLYTFISPLSPNQINMYFLGVFDMLGKSAFLALLAGVTQYFQIALSMPPQPENKKENKAPALKDEFIKSMNMQMRYVLPLFVFFISYTISAAVALYWTTNNLFTIIHELIVRKKADTITVKENTSSVK